MTEPSETTTAQGDPAGTAESPAAGSESRAGAGNEPDYKRMYLDLKGDREELNRLRAKVEELEQQPEPTPAAKAVTTDSADEDEALLREAARKGDVYARRILRQEESAKKREDEAAAARLAEQYAAQIKAMPAEQQRPVYDLFMKNRDKFGDPDAAYAYLEREELRKKIAALEAGEQPGGDVDEDEPKPRKTNAVPATPREGPTNGAATKPITMTGAQFDKKIRKFGLGTPEARAMERKLANGLIELEDE